MRTMDAGQSLDVHIIKHTNNTRISK